MPIESIGRRFLPPAAVAALWLVAAAASAQQAAPAGQPNPAPAQPAAQVGGPSSGNPSPAGAAPKCDAACVRANMDRASQACARPIEAQAPIDYDWLSRPYTGIFQEADQSDDKSAVAAYRGDSIRFMNPQKEWVRVTYECAFDTAGQKVIGVRVRPGRLGRPAQLGAAPQTAPKGAAAAAKQPQVKSEALAAAIAEAVRKRQQTPAAPTKPVRVGEPSPIDIQQINPSRAQ